MELSIRSNEYVHVLAITSQSNTLCAIYEPIEYRPVTNLTGTIYIADRLTQTFYIRDDREIVINTTPNWHKKYKPLSGQYIPDSGIIVIYWEKMPPEHFLCVSYEFNETIKEDRKSAWLQEGF